MFCFNVPLINSLSAKKKEKRKEKCILNCHVDVWDHC